MNQTPLWYDKLSIAHDLLSFRDWPYWRARKQAISALELQRGDTVVALFCGTGTSFHWIIPQIGRSGTPSSVTAPPPRVHSLSSVVSPAPAPCGRCAKIGQGGGG